FLPLTFITNNAPFLFISIKKRTKGSYTRGGVPLRANIINTLVRIILYNYLLFKGIFFIFYINQIILYFPFIFNFLLLNISFFKKITRVSNIIIENSSYVLFYLIFTESYSLILY